MATSEMIFEMIFLNDKGERVFYKPTFTYPDSWDYADALMFAKHYSAREETSVEQTLKRILAPFSGIVEDDTIEDMYYMLLKQKACLNSPAMFNLGIRPDPIASACFIVSVEDDMVSIADLYSKSMAIFKQGAGVGASFHKLRASMEKLSNNDGRSSGPVPFMRILDRVGDVVKSGGRLRRAAIMVINRVDHPDICEFIDCKIKEEQKARVLSAAGYGNGIESEAYRTVSFQNMNISVSVTDDFMEKAQIKDAAYELKLRTTGEVYKTEVAESILDKIAQSCWECGDPGVQFFDTINRDNPFRDLGEKYIINASNPCSEFVFLDNSACNLGSINLTKFYDGEQFHWAEFSHACSTLTTIMDAIIDIAHYPTPEIANNSRHFRPLGLGYTGLGALLMRMGIPYGNADACKIIEDITRTMAFSAWMTSHALFENKGSDLTEQEQRALSNHVKEKFKITCEGYRNSQVTLLAPTGTISFVMGTGNSTGIEPILALEASKSVIGGGTIRLVAKEVTDALLKVGKDTLEDALADPATRDVFATAYGEVRVSPENHINAMVAAQKWLCGAISKTVAVSSDATTEDIKQIFIQAYKRGLKCIAIYRDGSKMAQPITTRKEEIKPKRERMPETRNATTHHFEIMGEDGYITLGHFDDGRIGEIFVSMCKQGSTVQGLLHSWSIAISMALQYGAPLDDIIRKYRGMKFDPSGFTANRDIEICHSIVDYVSQYIIRLIDGGEDSVQEAQDIFEQQDETNTRTCPACGNVMLHIGRCHLCSVCGTSGGCS